MATFDNIIWESLSGSQRSISIGNELARRYAPGFPLIMAFADPAAPDFEAIESHCPVGEKLYCVGWDGTMPSGWNLDVDAAVASMSYRGEAPPIDPRAVRLGEDDTPAMRGLFETCKPGPYATRLMEIGEWYGVFEEGRLVAMAGERMHAGEWREISGVATLPEAQGKGYARLLTHRLIASHRARGLKTFLHVFPGNTRAVELYKHMGFAVEREMPLRVVSRLPDNRGQATLSEREKVA